jgi:glycogen synthase
VSLLALSASTGAEFLADGIASALGERLRIPDARSCRDYARANYDNAVIARRVADVYR